MDVQALIQEHKVFLRNVGIGLAIYLILMYFAQSMGSEANAWSINNDKSLSSLSQKEKQLKSVEGREKGRAASLTQVEPKVFTQLLWFLDDQYKLADDSANKFLDYTKLRRTATYQIKKAAQLRTNIIPDSYGFLSNKDNEALIPEHQIRLDLTVTICKAILTQSTNAKIESVTQQRSTYSKLPFETNLGQYLQKIPTSFLFVLEPRKIPAVLAAVQSQGHFAQVLKFEQTQISPTSPVVKVELQVAALKLSKSIVEDKSQPATATPGGGRPIRPNRGLRKFGRPR